MAHLVPPPAPGPSEPPSARLDPSTTPPADRSAVPVQALRRPAPPSSVLAAPPGTYLEHHPLRAGPTARGAHARRTFRTGLWRLADPKISLASFASVFLGTCLAAAAGPLHPGWLVLTVLAVFAIEVAKNAAGEIYDWDAGVDQAVAPEDRSPFSGGKRVLVDGLLTRGQTVGIAAVAYAVGILAGLVITGYREPAVLWLGLVGVALAYSYHGPPLRLAFRGFGELAVALVYGPLIALGAYLVQRGSLSVEVLLASLPLGLLIAAFLWINEFPDYRADAAGGKRNLVVRLGRRRASQAFAGLVVVAFALLAVLPFAGLPAAVLLGALGAPPAIWAAHRLLREPESVAHIVPAQAMTLVAFLLLALGVGLGGLLG